MRHFRNDGIGSGFVLDIDKDDRGRLVAEVWDEASGKTLATVEVDSIGDGEYWAKKAIELYAAKDVILAHDGREKGIAP